MADIHETVTKLEKDTSADLDVKDKATGLMKRERLVIQATWAEAMTLGGGTVALALFNL